MMVYTKTEYFQPNSPSTLGTVSPVENIRINMVPYTKTDYVQPWIWDLGSQVWENSTVAAFFIGPEKYRRTPRWAELKEYS